MHLIGFHVHFMYILMEMDHKEFAHACICHILSVLQSKLGYIYGVTSFYMNILFLGETSLSLYALTFVILKIG